MGISLAKSVLYVEPFQTKTEEDVPCFQCRYQVPVKNEVSKNVFQIEDRLTSTDLVENMASKIVKNT